jgi:hypothetical protein
MSKKKITPKVNPEYLGHTLEITGPNSTMKVVVTEALAKEHIYYTSIGLGYLFIVEDAKTED